jgi:hypothetical protein
MKKGTDTPDFNLIVKKFEEAFSITHPIFDSLMFHFNKSDQTLEYYGMQEWADREVVIEEATIRMAQCLTGSNIRPAGNDLTYDRPFRIDDLLEDEFDLINAGV